MTAVLDIGIDTFIRGALGPYELTPRRLSQTEIRELYLISARYIRMTMRGRATSARSTIDLSSPSIDQHSQPDPDPEPPAAPPVIILSHQGKARPAAEREQGPAFQPPCSTSSEASAEYSTTLRYNFRTRKNSRLIITRRGSESPDPDPFPATPPVIIESSKRPASTSPPRSPPSTQTITIVSPLSHPILNSTTSTSPTTTSRTTHTAQTSAIGQANIVAESSYITHLLPTDNASAHYKHDMGSKASKLAPSHGKLQPAQSKQDKEEMKEPSNYYTHRSKSMRRKAGKTGATSNVGGAAGGGGGGGAGGIA